MKYSVCSSRHGIATTVQFKRWKEAQAFIKYLLDDNLQIFITVKKL